MPLPLTTAQGELTGAPKELLQSRPQRRNYMIASVSTAVQEILRYRMQAGHHIHRDLCLTLLENYR